MWHDCKGYVKDFKLVSFGQFDTPDYKCFIMYLSISLAELTKRSGTDEKYILEIEFQINIELI